VVGTVTHSGASRHNNPLSDSDQNNQESQQKRHYSLTGATVNEEGRRIAARLAWLASGVQTEWRSCELRVNEERRRLAARLAWLAAGVQTEWRCCELRVNGERRRLAARLAWLAAGVQTEWRCCELRVIVTTMVVVPLYLEIKTQSRDCVCCVYVNPRAVGDEVICTTGVCLDEK